MLMLNSYCITMNTKNIVKIIKRVKFLFFRSVFWNWVTSKHPSTEFIEYYKDAIDWGTLIRDNSLSEDLLDKYWDKAKKHIVYVSCYQNIQEDFIRKHVQDFIQEDSLVKVLQFRDVSTEFIKEYFNEINFNSVFDFMESDWLCTDPDDKKLNFIKEIYDQYKDLL